jgi:cytochrome P450
MANPTRFPRATPPHGFSFSASTSDNKDYYIPPGVNVGLQLFTLHFNPAIFPDPMSFKPERWLDPTPEMQRDCIPFGLGTRQCIARNLATAELFLAIRAVAREGVLEGAEAVGEKIEILEWFNSKVKSEKLELVWR